MIVEANGLHFQVEVEGERVPVVLLHGFPDTSRLWRGQVPALVEVGYRTIAPDLRGRGRSDRPAAVADYALRSIVKDVTRIMDALGALRAHVVGHDWGAGVAWLLLALEPSRVERLVAISVGFPGAAGRPDLAEWVAGGWRYERIEDASHWVPLDEPDRLNALLLKFLASLTAVGAELEIHREAPMSRALPMFGAQASAA